MPKGAANLIDLPRLSKENPEIKTKVQELVSQFYEDIDQDEMGIGIYSAQNTKLGAWAYSSDETSWTEVRAYAN